MNDTERIFWITSLSNKYLANKLKHISIYKYKMPKTPMDYSKCCIYKIEHIEDESLVYVGHTTCFNKRKARHKHNCINELSKNFNIKLYQMMRVNGGWNMFKMIEVQKYECKDKREAEKREDKVMKELKANMNVRQSFLTEEDKKGYYEQNKEIIKERLKEYYETNKETISLKSKEYREKNHEKLNNRKIRYYENNKQKILEQQKKYYDDNIEKRKRYSNQYREKNKEEIKIKKQEAYHRDKEKNKEKIICECGCRITKRGLIRHQATQKHINKTN